MRTAARSIPSAIIGQQFYYFGGYIQDDWRVTPKLVLNLGLRYDINLPPTGLGDRWSDFGPTTPNPAAGGIPGAVLFAGSCTGCVGSRTLADLWDKGFGPHIGLAYSKDSKTVIRASYARSLRRAAYRSAGRRTTWASR